MGFPVLAVIGLAAGAGLLIAKSKASGKLMPSPATSYVQGKSYSLLFLSTDVDPVTTSTNLFKAGYKVSDLPVMQRGGVPIPEGVQAGGLLTEWLATAQRIGPTVNDSTGGLEGFAILENGQQLR
jgi:hypothetical protein